MVQTCLAWSKDGALRLSLERKVQSLGASRHPHWLVSCLRPSVMFEQLGLCFWGLQQHKTRNVQGL